MDLNATKMGKVDTYIAPDPHFISTISLLASSLPWDKFAGFFEKKKLVKLSGDEQLILLRLLALQEVLCLDDDELLAWSKHQLYLFSFMQKGYKARQPTKQLLVEFRGKLDHVGLLKPFRKQCQRIIQEHETRYPPLVDTGINTDMMADLSVVSETICPSCGSHNVAKLSASQEASTLPDVSFSRCRFCGQTFRARD